MSQFDPAAHLSKHGWKGKGTALKHGHATRPLPVVQKKTLTGIGKDRDEAVPFWDHIFASTASTLFTSLPANTTSTPPIPNTIKTTTTTSWQTLTTPRQTLSATAKSGKEIARRGLYSKFFRGTTLSQETSPEVEVLPSGSQTPLVSEVVVDAGSSVSGVKLKGETREEKMIRRAARAERKAEKEAKRFMKERKERKERKSGRLDEIEVVPRASAIQSERSTKKSKKRKTIEDVGDGLLAVSEIGGEKKKRKREVISDTERDEKVAGGSGSDVGERLKREKSKMEKSDETKQSKKSKKKSKKVHGDSA